jgi:hypothetical protein
MTEYYLPGWISWEMPDDWNVEESEGVQTMTHPDGVGALQVSFKRLSYEQLPLEKAQQLLSNFAARQEAILSHVRCDQQGDATFASGRLTVRDEDGPRVVLVWFFVTRDRGVLVTHNVWLEDGLVETRVVHEIVNSIRFESTEPTP